MTRGVTRPVWEPDAKGMALYETARRHRAPARLRHCRRRAPAAARTAISPARWASPTLDGLGVQGAGGHTLDEHILVDSLAARGRLMAGLLAALD